MNEWKNRKKEQKKKTRALFILKDVLLICYYHCVFLFSYGFVQKYVMPIYEM